MFVVIKWDDDISKVDIVTDKNNNIRKFNTFAEAAEYGLINCEHFKIRQIGTVNVVR